MVNKFKLGGDNSTATKDAINRTLAIANNYAGELSIEVLSLDKIELDPDNNRELALTLSDARNGIDKNDPDYDRKKQDWKSLESLAKTIKDEQLINPIFVYRFGNKCRLISGERRTLASAIAGKNEIIARIASQRPVGMKLRVLQWIENNERADLSLAERISSIEAIIKEYYAENQMVEERITAKLLGDITGMSMTQARRYILILQSKPEIKSAIIEGKLENIKLIEFICSIKDSEHQNKLLSAAVSGLPFEAVIKLKKELESSEIEKQETRGRKKINVSLGSVRTNLAKLIIDALLSSNILESKITQQIQGIYQNAQWDEIKSAEKGFKKIMLLLESGV
jgi:ParB family transcriptional regulator, chromosome partitioning protein